MQLTEGRGVLLVTITLPVLPAVGLVVPSTQAAAVEAGLNVLLVGVRKVHVLLPETPLTIVAATSDTVVAAPTHRLDVVAVALVEVLSNIDAPVAPTITVLPVAPAAIVRALGLVQVAQIALPPPTVLTAAVAAVTYMAAMFDCMVPRPVLQRHQY